MEGKSLAARQRGASDMYSGVGAGVMSTGSIQQISQSRIFPTANSEHPMGGKQTLPDIRIVKGGVGRIRQLKKDIN